MQLSKLREQLLQQHAALRELIAEVGAQNQRSQDQAGDDELRRALGKLTVALGEHNRFEESSLRGVIAKLDAWGPQRESLMDSRQDVYKRQGQRTLGQIARRQAVLNAEHTATALKRLLGMRFGHPQVRQLADMVAYRILPGPADELRVVLRNEPYSVVELVAAMLLDLKQSAEAYLGQPVSRAVLTAPLAFSDAQRIALRDAARLAGLEVMRIIADPIAAALALSLIHI